MTATVQKTSKTVINTHLCKLFWIYRQDLSTHWTFFTTETSYCIITIISNIQAILQNDNQLYHPEPIYKSGFWSMRVSWAQLFSICRRNITYVMQCKNIQIFLYMHARSTTLLGAYACIITFDETLAGLGSNHATSSRYFYGCLFIRLSQNVLCHQVSIWWGKKLPLEWNSFTLLL